MSELKPRITENGIDYILVGDYYIPDLKLPEEHRPVGKYGRLHLSQRHHTHTVCRKEKRCLFRVRGIYGLPFFPNHPAQEQPDLSLYRLAGLHHPELDRQCG